MKNIVACATLGLSVVAGSLALTKPAAALDPFVMVNAKSQLADPNHPYCMGVRGGPQNGHLVPGTPLITWDCTFATDQVFSLTNTPGLATFMFQDQIRGPQGQTMCLTDFYEPNDSGRPLLIEPCTGAWTQQFWLIGDANVPGGCFRLQNAVSGRVVGAANGAQSPISRNMSIIMRDNDNGTNDEVWCLPDALIPIG